MAHAVPVIPESLLRAYAQRGAFTDCYAHEIPLAANLPDLVEAFYTTRLFKLERWLLARAFKIRSTDREAAELARGTQSHFAAWNVEQRSAKELLLDAGQTRSWLAVAPASSSAIGTTLLFGSAVMPMRPGGKFGLVFHALLGFHKLYSKLLLGAAARRLEAKLSATT